MSADKELRIALVTELYPPSVGGQQTRFASLAEGLVDLGDRVSVICVRDHLDSPRSETVNGVDILRSPTATGYERPWLRALQRSPVATVRFAIGVRRFLSHNEFDAIYFNQWPYLHILFTPRASRAVSAIDWCEYRGGLIHRLAQRHLPRLVSKNLSVNEWTAEQISTLAGVPVGYLPSGVDLGRFTDSKSAVRSGILFLGRLVENKNLPLLVRSFALMCSNGFDENLRIAGDGPLRVQLDEEIQRLPGHIRERVFVLGRVDDETKIELLRTSRVLAMPSLREGFPNVVSEAAASNLPIATVSSPDNGAAHVVRRYGFGCVGDPNVEGFAGAITDVLEHHDELVVACAQAASELDWKVLTRQLHNELLEIADRRGGLE